MTSTPTLTRSPAATMTTSRSPLLALLTVTAIANIGIRVSGIAIPWFVLTTTGSATQTGLVAAFELAPYAVVKALSGPIIDRLGQRRISIGADLASAVVIGGVPLFHLLGLLSFPMLLLLVALGGALRAPGDNAKHTSIPLVAEMAGAPLERVTGLSGAIERGSGLVAPALAAVMIALIGPAGAIAATAACFAVSAIVVFAGLPSSSNHIEDSQDSGDGDGGGRYLHELREGFRFLLADRLLLTMVLMIMFTNLLDTAKVTVLLPVWVHDGGYGVAAISLLLTCMAAFSMVSSLLASWLGPRLPRRRTYFIAFAISGPPPFIALGLDLPLWVIAAVYCVAGFASGFLNPMIGAIFFERIPRPLLGRVGGLATAVAWGAMPLGGPLAALVISLAGLSPAFLIAAAGYALATALPALAARASFDPPRAIGEEPARIRSGSQPPTAPQPRPPGHEPVGQGRAHPWRQPAR